MDKRPSIGVVIATPGRRSLFVTLRSIAYQELLPGDDILVVGDGYHQATADLVSAFGFPFRYMATEVTRTWGHDQLNAGVKLVKGDVLCYQDDDDIFAPRAFDEIRRLTMRFPDVPILGRVKTPNLGLLWQKAAPDATLDGHCLVVPNVKEKLGYFTREYAGDQAWIKTCLEPYESVYWADRVWSLTRPTWNLYPARLTAKLRERYQPETDAFFDDIRTRLIDGEGRLFNGPDDWCWIFFDPDSGSEGRRRPVAMIKMFQDEERMKAAVSFLSGAEPYLEEIAEFLAWAGQGLPIWLYVHPGDYEVIEACELRRYEKHWSNETKAEYIHEWPPTFFEERKEVKPLIIDPAKEG